MKRSRNLRGRTLHFTNVDYINTEKLTKSDRTSDEPMAWNVREAKTAAEKVGTHGVEVGASNR